MISPLQLFFALVRRRFDPSQIVVWMGLRRALEGCDSILDVGCGDRSNLRLLQPRRLVGIDGYAPSVERARQGHTHDELFQGDVRQLDRVFQPGQFDACVALDVIEHLPKEEGLKLAQAMERVAARRVVFLTPNGFLPQHHTEQQDLQEHLSGWDSQDFRQLGYRVGGVLGPQSLRGEYHVLKYRPRPVWGAISLLGQLLWCSWRPGSAAALLAVKYMR